MSTARIGSVQRDDETGEIRFDINDEGELKSAFRSIFKTEIGQRYLNDYVSDRDDTEAVVNTAKKFAGEDWVTEEQVARAMQALMDTNLIPRKKVQAPAAVPVEIVDSTPRDKNGKPLTAQQIKWSEYRQFAETASSAEINQRRKNDPDGFGAFVRKSMEHEMQLEQVGDAVIPAGEATTKARASGELVDFATKYNREPIANLRPRGGFVVLAGEQMPYSKFLELTNKAIAARLLF